MIKRTKNKEYFEYILNNLRSEDLCEVKCLWKNRWRKEVLKSLENSSTLVLFADDKPIAMGGFFPVENKMCIVWLLSTKEVLNHKFLLMKTLKEQIRKAEKKYDLMFNYIYKSNFEAKKWLKKLGFKFDKQNIKGLKIKEDFEFFYKIKKGVFL